MEIVIMLLENAIENYKSGKVSVGDQALYAAQNLRKIADRASKPDKKKT